MNNLALESTGAQVSQASSWDSRHPPDSVIDGQTGTFWTTTGMFPHELIITFDSVVQISSISTRTFNVKRMKLYRSVAQHPSDFNEISESDINGSDKAVVHEHKISDTTVRHLKIEIVNGHDDFSGMYWIKAKGENLALNPFG
eukprot:m.75884 g.75884  ORF g.75884 m.75884 type:complete len:143 (+) comp24836_c0_seq2:117-545(+)